MIINIVTIVYKSEEDALWSDVVFIREEYPDLNNNEFQLMCYQRYEHIKSFNDEVYICCANSLCESELEYYREFYKMPPSIGVNN